MVKVAGVRKGKVALARRLAVIMHKMLIAGTPFDPSIGMPALAKAA